MIDDAKLRMLVVSDHPGDVDPLRVYTVLHRTPPPDAIRWVVGFGIETASTPTRIEPNPELGIGGRVCIPIRWKDALLGYMWLLEIEGPLSRADMDAVHHSAEDAAAVMYRQRLVEQSERARVRQLGTELGSVDPAVRDHAADRLVREGAFGPGLPVVAVVVQPWHVHGERPPHSIASTFTCAMEAELAPIARHGRLGWVQDDHAVVVAHAAPDSKDDPVGIGASLGATVERLLDRSEWRCLIGVGDIQPSLKDTFVSYRQALRAARVGATLGGFGTVVRWSDLGIYGMFAALEASRLTTDVLHPGFLRLLAHHDSTILIQTVERFLDRAGDVQATAAELFLHRGTLYNRLHKVERVAALSLGDGNDRLALHLSIKLARLAGVLPWAAEPRDRDEQERAASAK